MRNCLHCSHHEIFDEVVVKQCEDAEKKAEEGQVTKQKRQSESCQLTLVELKEQKELWNYNHPEHKQFIKRIAEMIAINSQLFSIAEDRGFIRLLAYESPRYITPSKKYFSKKLCLKCILN